jgi:zinc D-Ala-D-Ala carboxypeptidase
MAELSPEAGMRLTEHFTLEEFTRSQRGARRGIKNVPNTSQIHSMTSLCLLILERIRDITEMPISISSGYRCPALNRLVGGSRGSQHMKGEAADIYINGITPKWLFDTIRKTDLPFDQLILENPDADGWVHISYTTRHPPRREVLIAYFEGKKRIYRKVEERKHEEPKQ